MHTAKQDVRAPLDHLPDDSTIKRIQGKKGTSWIF